MKNIICLISLFLATLFFSACATNSSVKKSMLELSASTMEERALQTRSFDTNDTLNILSVSVATLQDLGFSVDEISRDFGAITASKERDARETGQQVGLGIVAFLGILAGAPNAANIMDSAYHTQTIRASVVSIRKREKSIVRLTVQRIMYNSKGIAIKVETVNDPEIYQQFFEKVSENIFLEGHKL